MSTASPVTRPVVRPETDLEPPYRVLLHNDDVTPYEFVIVVLLTVFALSDELAEHITWEAHHRGVAPVVTRPRSEAEALVAKAHNLARSHGYPLTLSIEASN
jgi:ATP-dependent Clp protease adaptor protein ClpS